MSWLFSRALVAEYSGATSLGGAPCAQLNSMNTHGMYWLPGKTTDALSRSRSGMTYAPSTENHGAGLLTWFLAGFHVRTSVQQESTPASTESVADSGGKWPASLAKYDPDTCLWKTRQILLFGGGGRVLGDLARMGYDAKWGIVGASNVGCCHERKRIWIIAFDSHKVRRVCCSISSQCPIPSTTPERQFERAVNAAPKALADTERLRDSYDVARWVDRLQCLGNGQVPAVVRLAWEMLTGDERDAKEKEART